MAAICRRLKRSVGDARSVVKLFAPAARVLALPRVPSTAALAPDPRADDEERREREEEAEDALAEVARAWRGLRRAADERSEVALPATATVRLHDQHHCAPCVTAPATDARAVGGAGASRPPV